MSSQHSSSNRHLLLVPLIATVTMRLESDISIYKADPYAKLHQTLCLCQGKPCVLPFHFLRLRIFDEQ
jgi:hypothetical protein